MEQEPKNHKERMEALRPNLTIEDVNNWNVLCSDGAPPESMEKYVSEMEKKYQGEAVEIPILFPNYKMSKEKTKELGKQFYNIKFLEDGMIFELCGNEINIKYNSVITIAIRGSFPGYTIFKLSVDGQYLFYDVPFNSLIQLDIFVLLQLSQAIGEITEYFNPTLEEDES